MMTQLARRRGLTLIELLTVIGVIAILAALLTPAVQAARRSAQSLGCLNNLKQIGLALHSYHAIANCLPPGRFRTYDRRYQGDNPPCSTIMVEKSFLLQILPYMEQQALYNAINHDLAISGLENSTIWAVPVAAYACPSDPDAAGTRSFDETAMKNYSFPVIIDQPVRMSYTSYSGCFGSLDTLALPQERYGCKVSAAMIAQNNGCFHDRAPMTFGSITDGLAQTILVGEKALGTLRVLDAGYPGTTEFDRYGWATVGNMGDTLFTGMYPPNGYKTGSTGKDIGLGASSYHPGGVNVLMGDGSARFIGEAIQSWPLSSDRSGPAGATYSTALGSWQNVPGPGVWQALCARAGGESIPSGEF